MPNARIGVSTRPDVVYGAGPKRRGSDTTIDRSRWQGPEYRALPEVAEGSVITEGEHILAGSPPGADLGKFWYGGPQPPAAELHDLVTDEKPRRLEGAIAPA